MGRFHLAAQMSESDPEPAAGGSGDRTGRTKGPLSAKTAKLMVFKLVDAAAKTWQRLKGENQLPKVIAGIKFKNGIEVIKMPSPRRLIGIVTQSPA